MITFFHSKLIDHRYPDQAVVAIGNFDGVHLGHQQIISVAKSLKKDCAVTVLTFNPHPTIELRPQAPLKLLMTYEEKRMQLEHYGVDFCVEEPFDAQFSQTTAHDFFHVILKERLKAVAIIVGEDFSFGHRREGNLDLMRKFCQETGTILKVVPAVMVEGAPVSSSRIRDCLAAGDLKTAQNFLGKSFFYRGEIVHGDKRGRTLGFPTANMKCEEKFPLLPGVYVTSVSWRNQVYPSVTNIGTRPTFQNSEHHGLIPLRIETHILDQDFDLYGETLEVCFEKHLRPEKKFSSIQELVTQIKADTFLARAYFNA
jgi:riboflavin kinase/FMN adenylyltransferase